MSTLGHAHYPLLAATLTMFAVSSPSHAQGSAGAEADIRALIAGQAAAWNRMDAKAWAAPFLPSAEFINIRGTSFSGRPAIEGITARIFSSFFKGSVDSVTIRKIVWVTPDVVTVQYDHNVSSYVALPPGTLPSVTGANGKGELHTRMVYVLHKEADGKWMIVNGQNTAILPDMPPA